MGALLSRKKKILGALRLLTCLCICGHSACPSLKFIPTSNGNATPGITLAVTGSHFIPTFVVVCKDLFNFLDLCIFRPHNGIPNLIFLQKTRTHRLYLCVDYPHIWSKLGHQLWYGGRAGPRGVGVVLVERFILAGWHPIGVIEIKGMSVISRKEPVLPCL